MKKVILIITMALLLVNCVGCRSEGSRVITESYKKDGIVIDYPSLQDVSNTTNTLIKTEALRVLDYYSDSVSSDLSLKIDYKIKLLTDTDISIAYSGIGNVRGSAHPNSLFYTTNIDLKTGKKLRLKDFSKIDTAFLDKLREAAKSQLSSKLAQSFQNYDDEQLVKYLDSADTLDYGVDNQYDTFSYLTKDSIGISLPVGHAAGDHIEVEVSR